jgi:hypothetical protein
MVICFFFVSCLSFSPPIPDTPPDASKVFQKCVDTNYFFLGKKKLFFLFFIFPFCNFFFSLFKILKNILRSLKIILVESLVFFVLRVATNKGSFLFQFYLQCISFDIGSFGLQR